MQTHPAFTVEFSPEAHSFCGDLTYTATFDSNSVTTSSQPFAYIANELKIILESTDETLIALTKPYVLTAEFTRFPQAANSDAPSVTQMNYVNFIDPCMSPFTFASTSQTSPGSDKYSGNELVFTLNPFTITPLICEVEYTCTSVQREDDENAASDISCSDLTDDANLKLINGKLTFSAN